MNKKRERNFSSVAEAVDYINLVNEEMNANNFERASKETPNSSMWTWIFTGVLELYREALGIASLNNALPPKDQLNAARDYLEELGRKIPKVDIKQALEHEYSFMIGTIDGYDDKDLLTARITSSLNMTIADLKLARLYEFCGVRSILSEKGSL